MLMQFVALPDPLKQAITLGVVFVVAWVLAQITKVLPWLAEFLGQYVDEFSVAISSAIVLAVQNFLNTIPATYDGIVGAVMQFLVALLTVYGLFKFLGKQKVRTFTA